MRVLLVASANGKIDVAGRSFSWKANFNEFTVSTSTSYGKKFSRSDIQLSRLGTWISMNQRFLRVFPEQQICKPKLVYQARTYGYLYLVPLYLYLPSCYRGFQAYKRSTSSIEVAFQDGLRLTVDFRRKSWPYCRLSSKNLTNCRQLFYSKKNRNCCN